MFRLSDATASGGRQVPSFGVFVLAGAIAVCAPATAMPHIADALSLCADSELSLSERATAFASAGWIESNAESEIIEALAAGIFISNVESGAPETWDEEHAKSGEIASKLRNNRGFERLRFLGTPNRDATITLEPNGSGLDTCLFTGASANILSAAHLIGSKVLVAGPRASVRGDFSGGLLVAHAFDPPAGAFDPSLRFKSTFTIVLDRNQRD